MIVVAAVLDGEHRLHDAWRESPERDRPPLLALGDHRGQQRRVERQAIDGFAVELEALDAIGGRGGGAWPARRRARPACTKDDARRSALEARAARQERDGAGVDGELAGAVWLAAAGCTRDR